MTNMRANFQTMNKLEQIKCVTCNKPFYRTKEGQRTRVPGIRRYNAINCSKLCSRKCFTSQVRTKRGYGK